MQCPSCHAAVPPGETICLDCGTELVFTTPPAVAPQPVPEPSAPKHPGGKETLCADCGERVRPDANGFCPICGHDFGGRIEIDEDEFFRDPPSLEQAMEAERTRLRADLDRTMPPSPVVQPGPAGTMPLPGDTPPPRDASVEDQAQGEMPLPGDRHRQRFRSSNNGEYLAVEAEAWLIVEGGQSVFFDGRMTGQVRLDVDQILIGRRDPSQGHYPDIDLGHFRHIDGHISRRHARIYRRQGQWFLEDLCDNAATYLNDKGHVLNGETTPLKDGDQVLVSDSVAMTFRLQLG